MRRHVFISYSRDDAAYVDRLVGHLTAAGLHVWTDLGIPAGADWARTIDKQIRACAVVVPVMSHNSRRSDWVANEILLAQRLEKPIMPLLLAGEPFTELLSTQHEDVRDAQLPPLDYLKRLGQLTRRRIVLPGVPGALPARPGVGWARRWWPRRGALASVAAIALVCAGAIVLQRWIADPVVAVEEVVWSPDGTRLATVAIDLGDRDAWIWDAATAEPLERLSGHSSTVSAIDWSPDGTRVATASYDHTARTWDAATGANVHVLRTTDFVTDVAWSPDSAWIATAQWHGRPKIWNGATGELLHEVDPPCCPVAVAWSPDGARIAGGSTIWDAGTGQRGYSLGYTAGGMAWSPDGARLAVSVAENLVLLLDAATGQTLETLTGHTDYVRELAWSPDGTRLATTSSDNTTKVWDGSTGGLVLTFADSQGAAWAPDGTRLATSGGVGVRIWDAEDGQLIDNLPGRSGSLAWSPDGGRLAIGGQGLQIWDTRG